MTDHALLQSFDLSGRTALVTGASRGIGAATARVLAGYGARVVLCARSRDAIEAGAAAIAEAGGKASARVCDVTDWNAVRDAVEAEAPDILVNNAGTIAPLSLLHESDPQAWEHAVRVNLLGTYHGMRAALPGMIARGRGTVVNISSGAANGALPGWSHYCATKAGAQRLTQVAARELREAGHEGIVVAGLSPGTVATDMMADIRDSGLNAVSDLPWSAHIPPDWAAEGVAFLCGPEGAEFAGTDFSIKTPEGRTRVGLPVKGAPDA